MLIIQFGEGNFLRAFVEWIVQQANVRLHADISVAIVKPRPGTSLDSLRAQGCRYHVNLRGLLDGQTTDTTEEITCVSAAVNPYEDHAAFLALAERQDARVIVSNTTEAGIAFDASCRFGDTPPSSFPAKLTQLLYHRFRACRGDVAKGFIIMPCELISGNGRQLEQCVHQYIDLWSTDLAADAAPFEAWVRQACFFCTTLVDRIVPGYPKSDADAIQARLPEHDALLVQAEPYHLWVVEVPENLTVAELQAEFPPARAGLNVVVTTDEAPYHLRKVTLLNGAHTVLAPVALLAGLDIVRDACRHDIVGAFAHHLLYDELLPTLLPATSTADAAAQRHELCLYAAAVLERFCNPFIDHQLTSIMLNSFPKFAARDLPALKRYVAREGQPPRAIVLGLAATCVYYRGGCRPDGTLLRPDDDPRITQLLHELWTDASPRRVARGVLAATDIIWHGHTDLNAIPGLTDMLARSIESILRHGMMATVSQLLPPNVS